MSWRISQGINAGIKPQISNIDTGYFPLFGSQPSDASVIMQACVEAVISLGGDCSSRDSYKNSYSQYPSHLQPVCPEYIVLQIIVTK